MNQKPNFQLLILAAFVWGSLSVTCVAMQGDGISNRQTHNGSVRLVKPLPEIVDVNNNRIGSEAANSSNSVHLPPIASGSTSFELPPIVSKVDAEPDINHSSNKSGLLAPIQSVVVPAPTLQAPARVDVPIVQTVKPTFLAPIATAKPFSPLVPSRLMPIDAESDVADFQANEIQPGEMNQDFVAAQPANFPTDETIDQLKITAPISVVKKKNVQLDSLRRQPLKMVSSAGIPIYSTSYDRNEPSITQATPLSISGDAPPTIAPMLPITASSGVSPPATDGRQSEIPSLINWDNRQVVSSETVAEGVQPIANRASALPVSASTVDPTFSATTSYFDPQPTPTPALAAQGCDTCGDNYGNSVAGCQSCGSGGCFDSNAVDTRFANSGFVSSARRYFILEGLYFTRDDGNIAFTNFAGLGDFSSEGGVRLTFGERADSTMGREVSYMGTAPMDESITHLDALGRINTRFTPADGFTLLETGSFFDAVEQFQEKETQIHSLEYNRVKWGWDVLKTFVGIRYIYVEDDYRLSSRNLGGVMGTFETQTINNLIGPHVGGELFYDVGKRLSYSVATKAGIYANASSSDTRMTNDGIQYINNEDDNRSVAGSIELNFIARYQLSQRSRFRIGYNALWLTEVASVSDNFSPLITPSTGTQTDDSDDMLFNGFSFGWEIYR